MLKKVLIGLVVIVLAFVAFIATRPATFKITRTASIGAPADVVFTTINDFHNWDAWSPWAKLDPTMKKTIEGAPAGVGAIYGWSGTDKVGEGRMTITESKPGEKVVIKLEFLKPFTATNVTTFDIKPNGDKSEVTWTMEGNNNFMSKAMHVFMDMDKMIGKDFDKGLEQMKAVAEAESQKRMAEAKAAADAKAAQEAAAAAQAAAEEAAKAAEAAKGAKKGGKKK